MPLPWKTVKNARVSQLVNDHLHRSRKRRDGSSLFVETGFPTSLVDLFIKNREKLKKPSKKKRQTAPITEIPTTPFDSPAMSPLITGSPPRSPSISHPVLTTEASADGLAEKEVVYDTGVNGSVVLMMVLKMFLVVVLALSTKRLTVGITISAFLLFFFEYVGKHVCFVLKPFRVGKGFLGSCVKCVMRLFRFKEDLTVKMEREFSSKNDQEVLIQAVECEIQPVNEIIEDEVLFNQMGYYKTEPAEVIVVGEEESLLKRKSKRAKIKSKMKKLVPKKLRYRTKEHSSKMVENVGEEEEEDNCILLCEEEEDKIQYEDERKSDNGSELSFGSSWIYNEEDTHTKTAAFGELSESATMVVGKSEGIRTQRYLVVFMIVLAGLIGGRGFAVILTLSWFLMLKLGDKMQMCLVKVPIINSV